MDDKTILKVERILQFYKYNKHYIVLNKNPRNCNWCNIKVDVLEPIEIYTCKGNTIKLNFNCDDYCKVNGCVVKSFDELSTRLSYTLQNPYY